VTPRLSLQRQSFRRAARSLAVVAACSAPLHAQDPVGTRPAAATTIILVRHAERAAEPAADPVLSAAGEARAVALTDALAHAGITGIVTTQYQRTRLTAAPLAQTNTLTPVVVAATRDIAAHVRAVADTARALAAAGPVLVVGHSNTVPRIIAALGGPQLRDLCESEHATLFVLVLRPGAVPSLTRARYGAEDPPPGASCAR
jgi:broad specificity phosphatase PhoE